LYFPFPHRTSLFLCVTLHLCASAIKSTDVFRLNEPTLDEMFSNLDSVKRRAPQELVA
jgi:hypothetical protein